MVIEYTFRVIGINRILINIFMYKIKLPYSIRINIIVFVLPLKLSFMSGYFSPSRIDMTFFSEPIRFYMF